MSRTLYQQHEEFVTTPLPIALGGTGAHTAPEALVNLQLVDRVKIGQANGIAPLNADGQIPVQFLPPADVHSVSVSGKLTGYVGQALTFKITDYDFETSYDLSCDGGTISRAHDMITRTLPFGQSTGDFTVNGVVYAVDISTPSFNKPVFTAPTDNQHYFNNVVVFATDTPVYHNWLGVHTSTDWQVATDPAFTNIVQQAMNDVVNLVDLTSIPLTDGLLYYVRVRFNSLYNGELLQSSWSDSIRFTYFYKKFLVNGETQIIQTPDLNSNDITNNLVQFGHCVATDDTGNTLIIGARYKSYPGLNTTGAAYVYKRNGMIWELAQTILIPNAVPGTQFGAMCTLSGDASTLYIGRIRQDNLPNPEFYIYKLVNNEYVYHASFANPTVYTPASQQYTWNFGSSGCKTTYNGDRVLLEAQTASVIVEGTEFTYAGIAYLFDDNGVLLQQFTDPVAIANYASYGSAIDISGNGQIVSICGRTKVDENNAFSYIDIWTYQSTTTSYIRSQRLVRPENVPIFGDPSFFYDGFGRPHSLNYDGTRLFVSNIPWEFGPETQNVFYYTRTNGDFQYTSTITVPAQSARYGDFGYYCHLNNAGDVVTIIEENWDESWTNSNAFVSIYGTADGVTWEFINKFPLTNPFLELHVVIAKETSLMFVCEKWSAYGGLTNYGGSVSIYT